MAVRTRIGICYKMSKSVFIVILIDVFASKIIVEADFACSSLVKIMCVCCQLIRGMCL